MKKLGLALGAGGSRGVAHIGFLKALEEAEIPIACISGTSMGSVVGACYAAGISVEKMIGEVDKIKPSDLIDLSANPLKKLGLLKAVKMKEKLRELLGTIRISEMKIPFCCTAVDILKGTPKVFAGDELAFECVAARSSIPGIFRPTEIEGVMYVDGGLISRLPIDECRALGAEAVVTVDVLGEIREEKRLSNIFSVLFRTIDLYDGTATQSKLKELKPDLYLAPDLGSMSQYRFEGMPEAIEAGYRLGKDNISVIRELCEISG